MERIYEMMHNPVNSVQKSMIDGIEDDDFQIPSCKRELKSFVVAVMVAVDHEANEREFMDKCVSKAARTYFTLSRSTGQSVYISSIKNQMANTNYFKTLRKMALARGKDAMRLICSKMIKDGYAELDGINRIKMTDKAVKFIGG